VLYPLNDSKRTPEVKVATLYLVSTQSGAGKTALCAALASRFLAGGLKVGYLKPTSREVRQVGGKSIDEDASYLKGLLGLPEPADVLCTVAMTAQEMTSIVAAGVDSFQDKVKAALAAIGKGREILFLEGAGSPAEGTMVGLSAPSVASLAGAKTLLVARYDGPSTADDLLAAAQHFPSSLLGAVINMVPQEGLDFVDGSLVPFLKGKGLAILGVIPQDRTLMAITVGELAEYLEGEFLNNEDKKEELVENFLLGALSTDHMFDYYNRRKDIALVTSGEKTDIQLFGMSPSTKCMILTGYRRPTELVLAQASDHSIPLILVKEDTLTVAAKLEGLLARLRFHQERKLPRLQQLVEERFDFQALLEGLGVALES
jgi:hypothetical protein